MHITVTIRYHFLRRVCLRTLLTGHARTAEEGLPYSRRARVNAYVRRSSTAIYIASFDIAYLLTRQPSCIDGMLLSLQLQRPVLANSSYSKSSSSYPITPTSPASAT